MKSIEEQALEWWPEMNVEPDNEDWDIIEAECDRRDKRIACRAGANYAIGCIIEAIRTCDNDRNTDLYNSLWNCINELRK